jgi:hypothetical protein
MKREVSAARISGTKRGVKYSLPGFLMTSAALNFNFPVF